MAQSSYGADFNYETTAGSNTFTSLAGIVGMSLGGITRSSFSTSAINDASVYMSFLPGRTDPGEITFSLNFSAAILNTLISTLLADQDTTRDYRVEWGDGTNTDTLWTCAGFITAIGSEFPDEGNDRIVIPVSVKFSGAVTFAIAT